MQWVRGIAVVLQGIEVQALKAETTQVQELRGIVAMVLQEIEVHELRGITVVLQGIEVQALKAETTLGT